MKSFKKAKNLSIFLFINLIFFTPGFVQLNCQAEKVVTIAEGAAAFSLDPHVDTTQAIRNITDAICEPLVWYDFFKKEIVPNLATSWKLLDDNTWEFKLRKGVTFTNGEPFDANSVKFSIERMRDPELKSRLVGMIRTVKEVKIVDSHTIHLINTVPTPAMALFMTRIGMVPPKYVKEKGIVEFGKHPVGTGPFEFVKWVQDEFVEIKANKDYWKGRAKLDRVIFKSIPETITRMAALKTGEADLVSNVMLEEIPSIKKNKDLDIVTIPSIRIIYVQYNMLQDSPLRDKRVRQAMNYAVDVDSIIKNVLQGYGVRLNGQVISKEYDGYNPHLKPYPYDPKKARQLIKEAGAENYVFTLNAPSGRYLRDKEVAEVVGDQLNAAGIKTKVNIMEYGALMQQIFSKKFLDLGLWGLATPPPTADLFYGVGIRENPVISTYVNPEFVQTYDEAASTMNRDKRLKLFYEVGEICRDNPPGLFLYQQMTIYGFSKRLGGFKPSPDEWIDPYALYVK